jgi:hypothetical protein
MPLDPLVGIMILREISLPFQAPLMNVCFLYLNFSSTVHYFITNFQFVPKKKKKKTASKEAIGAFFLSMYLNNITDAVVNQLKDAMIKEAFLEAVPTKKVLCC